MKFSERYGYTLGKAIQLELIDDDLRNSLWNTINVCYWHSMSDVSLASVFPNNSPDYDEFWPINKLWTDFFKKPIDMTNVSPRNKYQDIRHVFLGLAWHSVYDCIQFIAQNDPSRRRSAQFQKTVNLYLEEEASGYRFVKGSITPIIDQIEIDEIETAVAGRNQPVAEHLNRALELLSDREEPDYRNSIKESISAVESQVKSTLAEEQGSLGDLLKGLDQKAPMHPALKDAFRKLYGFTSDEGGIRHALLDDSREVTFEEAKFMLVTCSAFINYVRGVTKS